MRPWDPSTTESTPRLIADTDAFISRDALLTTIPWRRLVITPDHGDATGAYSQKRIPSDVC